MTELTDPSHVTANPGIHAAVPAMTANADTVADPVYAVDVLDAVDVLEDLHNASHVQNLPSCEDDVAALLARGGGDPVVIMPDGTLRRLTQVADNWYLPIDPVEPT